MRSHRSISTDEKCGASPLADLPTCGGDARQGRGGHACSVSNDKTTPTKGAAHHSAPANQLPLPPHLPVATLKLPQDIGFLQSEIRSFESGR